MNGTRDYGKVVEAFQEEQGFIDTETGIRTVHPRFFETSLEIRACGFYYGHTHTVCTYERAIPRIRDPSKSMEG